MTDEQTQTVLTSLFGAFPSLGDYYQRHKSTLRPVWLSVLSSVDFTDAERVAASWVGGSEQFLNNYEYDRLAITLKRLANEMRSRRTDQKAFHAKYLQKGGAMDFVRKDKTGHIAIILGEMSKEDKITSEENKMRMDELIEWDRGGAEPEWFTEITQ